MAGIREICTGMQTIPILTADKTGVDRSKLPELSAPVPSSFPDLQKATLKNGLKVILASAKAFRQLSDELVFNAGYATDVQTKPGLASLAMDMIDEGTKTLNTLEISEKMQLLGASIYGGSDMDASYLAFNTLKANF